MAVKSILFDFDGTLVDSEPLHYRVWQELLRRYSVVFSEQHYQDLLLGVPSARSATLLVERLALPICPDTLLRQRNITLKTQLSETPPPLMPYAREVLTRIRQHGLKLALVTASDRESVSTTLNAHSLANSFDVTVTGDDINHSKPHPEGYRLALQQLRLAPHQGIAIEDSLTGVQAALAAELSCLGIRNGSTRPYALTRATHAFDHLGSACDWIVEHQT